jgi:uncharacterized membrane protein (DUF2068 family)
VNNDEAFRQFQRDRIEEANRYDAEQAVLKAIARDEDSTWYTRDRALARQGLVDHGNLAYVALMLAERGLIRIEPKMPGMPSYVITEKGRMALQ